MQHEACVVLQAQQLSAEQPQCFPQLICTLMVCAAGSDRQGKLNRCQRINTDSLILSVSCRQLEITNTLVMLTTENHLCFNQIILRSKMLIYTHDRSNGLCRKRYFPLRKNKVRVCTTTNLSKNSCHHSPTHHDHHHLLLN